MSVLKVRRRAVMMKTERKKNEVTGGGRLKRGAESSIIERDLASAVGAIGNFHPAGTAGFLVRSMKAFSSKSFHLHNG